MHIIILIILNIQMKCYIMFVLRTLEWSFASFQSLNIAILNTNGR